MKRALLSCLIIISFACSNAQTTINIPSNNEFRSYLLKRQSDICKKLYHLALNGKIKAYKTMRFDETYDTASLKIRASSDASVIRLPDHIKVSNGITYEISGPGTKAKEDTTFKKPEKGLKLFEFGDFVEIEFIQNIENTFNLRNKEQLKGIALLFSPSVYGYSSKPQPLFYISLKDMKSILDKNDLDFMSLIYYYSHYASHADIGGTYNAFRLINQGFAIIRPDSTFYIHLANMLSEADFYTYDLFYSEHISRETYDLQKGPVPKAIIYDVQQKEYINILTFRERYYEAMEILIPGNPMTGSSGRDTTIKKPLVLNNLQSISFDSTKKQLTRLNFEVWKYNSETLHFYTEIKNVSKIPAAKTFIWLYEDYIRWKHL